jgi:hypothetical protein
MSQATGVPTSQADVLATFTAVRQQLPSSNNIEGFLSSQQMGITQLAIEYCNSLIEDQVLRSQMFPTFDFDSPPSTAFSSGNRSGLIDPLIASALQNGSVTSQPDITLVRAELDNLIDRLASSGSDANRTRTIAKASCASLIGSAALLIQ